MCGARPFGQDSPSGQGTRQPRCPGPVLLFLTSLAGFAPGAWRLGGVAARTPTITGPPGPYRETARAMAKGQKKGNREIKKPKAVKKPEAAAVDPRYALSGKMTAMKNASK